MIAYAGYYRDDDIFSGRLASSLLIQLRPFDAEEWHSNILEFHAHEIGWPLDKLMTDASELLELAANEDHCYLNPQLLYIAKGYLLIYNRLHSTQLHKVNLRVQAIQAVPILRLILPLMVDSSFKIRECIDARENLWDAIFESFPGRRATLKRLCKDDFILSYWKDSLSSLQALLDPLPLEKFPASEKEWDSFFQICRALRIQSETRPLHREVKFRWLIQFSKTGWVEVDPEFGTVV